MNIIELNKLISKKYATINDVKAFTNEDELYCLKTFNHLKELSNYKGYLSKKDKVYMQVFIDFFNINTKKVKESIAEIYRLYNITKLGVINCNDL